MQTARVTICGRKEPGYPQMKFEIPFETVPDLLAKIDWEADKLEWRKIDVYVEPEGLTEEQKDELEKNDCSVSNFY